MAATGEQGIDQPAIDPRRNASGELHDGARRVGESRGPSDDRIPHRLRNRSPIRRERLGDKKRIASSHAVQSVRGPAGGASQCTDGP